MVSWNDFIPSGPRRAFPVLSSSSPARQDRNARILGPRCRPARSRSQCRDPSLARVSNLTPFASHLYKKLCKTRAKADGRESQVGALQSRMCASQHSRKERSIIRGLTGPQQTQNLKTTILKKKKLFPASLRNFSRQLGQGEARHDDCCAFAFWSDPYTSASDLPAPTSPYPVVVRVEVQLLTVSLLPFFLSSFLPAAAASGQGLLPHGCLLQGHLSA